MFSYLSANNVLTTFSYYAGNDRLQSQELHDPDTGEKRLTEWTYLATGEVKTVTTGTAIEEKSTLTFNYDAGNRLTSIVDGLGNSIEYMLDSEGNIELANPRCYEMFNYEENELIGLKVENLIPSASSKKHVGKLVVDVAA